jgi:superfamily II DNA/RNA helicase
VNFETFSELREEFLDNDDSSAENQETDETKFYNEAELLEIQSEIRLLRNFYELANSIEKNSKGEKLLTALSQGFQKAKELKASPKAIIFTESTKTQNYIYKILSKSNHQNKVVLFNGSNNDEKSREIYKNWVEKYRGTDKVSESKTANMRQALVDYFKEEADIMIATEAAAEGINLQFCSLVINYDLPWNPQRIGQRIGRCHRYGQKFDVVVINFLNKKNAADQRVYELLNNKFKLFESIFGASDEVLGAISSGIDFEKRIADIYQTCRNPEEINKAFDELQSEFESSIDESFKSAKQKLLENFDEEVREKLKISKSKTENLITKYHNTFQAL